MLLRHAAESVVSNILISKQEGMVDEIAKYYAANPELVRHLRLEIARVDLGIHDVEVRQTPHGAMMYFWHEGLDQPLPLASESHGTQQFLQLYPALLYALDQGGVAVLDELDAAIHPLLLPEILRWFHDPKRNPHNAQLWMSCHSVSLLEEFIKEEVLFCEKDARGCTRVYGLRDIQAVRRTENYYRKYLSGMYGAIPQIG